MTTILEKKHLAVNINPRDKEELASLLAPCDDSDVRLAFGNAPIKVTSEVPEGTFIVITQYSLVRKYEDGETPVFDLTTRERIA